MNRYAKVVTVCAIVFMMCFGVMIVQYYCNNNLGKQDIGIGSVFQYDEKVLTDIHPYTIEIVGDLGDEWQIKINDDPTLQTTKKNAMLVPNDATYHGKKWLSTAFGLHNVDVYVYDDEQFFIGNNGILLKSTQTYCKRNISDTNTKLL